MFMNILYACLMALLFTTMPVLAQDGPPDSDHQPPSAADLVAKIQSKLNLTQDQITAITPIIEKYASKREVIRQSIEDGSADRDSVRSQMKQLRDSENQELSQFLSADQMSQWEQMQSKGMHKHGNGQGGSEGNGQGDGEGNGNGG
jgi:hypothetical protein